MKQGSLGDLNPTPWAFMTGNCIGWVTYAFLLQNLFVFFGNCPGLLLSVWLNLCAAKLQFQEHHSKTMRESFVGFLSESRENRKSSELALSDIENTVSAVQVIKNEEHDDNGRDWTTSTADLAALVLKITSQQSPAPAPHEKIVMGLVILWTIVISIVSLCGFESRTNQLIVGFIVNLNLLFFYGAPLSTIFSVLRERSSASIHIWTVITNTANGAFWGAYGLAVLDPFIYIPNGIGAALGGIQIIFCVLFPRSSEKGPKETGNPAQMIPSDEANATATEILKASSIGDTNT